GLRATYYYQVALNDVFDDQGVVDLGFVLEF
ncbi:unnamed protein product, partial [marine sediment metagenome]